MEKRLVRNVQDKKIAGVCAGVADYFNMDHTLVRALWIIFTPTWWFWNLSLCCSLLPSSRKAMEKLKP